MYGFMTSDAFTVLFFLAFFLILGIIIVTMIRGLIEWDHNNHSPRLTVDAVVTAKRMSVTHHHAQNSMAHSTIYYATFEVESGDRMELALGGRDYGQLAEGDRGRLTFQGTRYLGFERQ